MDSMILPNLIVRFRGVYATFSTVFVLCAMGITGWIVENSIQKGMEAPLVHSLSSYISTLEGGTINSRAMGAAILFGQEDADAKKLALGQRLSDPSVIQVKLDALRTLFLAEAVVLVNKHGAVIAYSEEAMNHGATRNLFNQINVQRALDGMPNVYPAVGAISHSRGIFLSAPLRSGKNIASAVIGAVIIKVGADKLDKLLKSWTNGIAVLVSPQGIVFASSHDEWLFSSKERLDGNSLSGVRRSRQFGAIFDAQEPAPLPFAINAAETSISNERYAVRKDVVEWGDAEGEWTLAFLERRSPWWTHGQVVGAAGIVGVIMLMLTYWYYFMLRNSFLLSGLNAKLKSSDEQLKESQNVAGLGTFDMNIASGLFETSDVADRIFGIGPDFVRSVEGWISMVHPEDRERVYNHFNNELLGLRKESKIEYRIFRHDDHAERWVLGVGWIKFDAEGQVTGMRGTVQDITERKLAEQELRTSMSLLEEKELAKSRFLAAAGHDLRQPLAAANLFIDALSFTNPTSEQEKIITRLGQAMSTFSGLLEALLNISRLDAGVIKPKREPIRLVELVEFLERNLMPLAHEKQLEFRVRYPQEKNLVVYSDIGLLQSVLMNLVANAIKFTAEGGILVSIRLRGREALFQVWDTGIGIEPGHLGHIFDEFYQINNPQRDRSRGLGLGLSIAKRTMTLLGGQLGCRSRSGRGSVFAFKLPAGWHDQATTHEVEIAGSPARAKGSVDMCVRSKNFVLLEDDILVAQGLSNWITALGGEVVSFQSVEAALEYAQLGDADYFIVDYMLGGGLNGIDFLNRVHERLGRPIKAVLMTGDTSPSFVREEARLHWPALHKPVQPSQLLAILCAQTKQASCHAAEEKLG